MFGNIDELCAYAAEHCTTFGREKASVNDWRRMLDEGYVRTEFVGPGGERHVFL